MLQKAISCLFLATGLMAQIASLRAQQPCDALAAPKGGPGSSHAVALELRLQWQPAGKVVLDRQNRLVLPSVTNQAGLYRFEMHEGSRTLVYIGETGNLKRRFYGYRNPGPRQLTNVRIGAELERVLRSGGSVEVALVTGDACLGPRSGCVAANLSSGNHRRLLEQAAIFSVAAGSVVVNR